MFGYRLVRETDWARLESLLDRTNADLHALLRERTTLAAQASSAKARADYCTVRLNVLETESAAMRQRLTGLPAVAATLGTTGPADPASSALTSLEDVGDARAQDLKDRGLLHDEDPGYDFPSAASLAPDVEAD